MKHWRALGRFLLALARELSDENAYRRHLAAALDQLVELLWAVEIGEVVLDRTHPPVSTE